MWRCGNVVCLASEIVASLSLLLAHLCNVLLVMVESLIEKQAHICFQIFLVFF
jgi:hypothetical protein